MTQQVPLQVVAKRLDLLIQFIINCTNTSLHSLYVHMFFTKTYKSRKGLINSITIFLAGPTLSVDEGWKLIVRSVRVDDASGQYSCSVLDSLTGERRRSTPISIDVAREYFLSIYRFLTIRIVPWW